MCILLSSSFTATVFNMTCRLIYYILVCPLCSHLGNASGQLFSGSIHTYTDWKHYLCMLKKLCPNQHFWKYLHPNKNILKCSYEHIGPVIRAKTICQNYYINCYSICYASLCLSFCLLSDWRTEMSTGGSCLLLC